MEHNSLPSAEGTQVKEAPRNPESLEEGGRGHPVGKRVRG